MTISRTEVFTLGDREVTVGNAFQLLYHSLTWGPGTKAPCLHARRAALQPTRTEPGISSSQHGPPPGIRYRPRQSIPC